MVIAVSQSLDFEAKELSPIMQTSQVCLFPLASSELDDLESESSNDEEMPKSYRKTLAARIIAWFMCLVTPTRQGEPLFQAQKRVFKSRMITRPAVYDESPAWYYTTPWAHASIRSQLTVNNDLSKRGFSDDDIDSINPTTMMARIQKA